MYNSILVPLDVSHLEHANNSLSLAEKLISDKGVIHAITVIETIPEYILAELPQYAFEQSNKKAEDSLKKAVSESGVKAQVHLEKGHAAQKILDAATRENADLIIVASHKPKMVDLLLGSTAASVVRKAKCNVFVTR